MIIYNEKHPPLLSDYGIEVPMLKGRAQKVQEEIRREFGDSAFSSSPLPLLVEEDFLRAHTKSFIKRCGEFPEEVVKETFELINEDGSYNRYNPAGAKKELKELVSLYRESCRESYRCVLEAYNKGFAYYLGGGFHHALSDRGRGFCLFNDIMIAARKFQHDINAGKIWVIDIDAHKGCGTAFISKNDESILSLSIHMKKGWPLDCGKFDKSGVLYPWHTPSRIDIEIDSGEEEYYIERLKRGLLDLEELSGEPPVLCIVVDGSDPYEKDALPSSSLLKLTREQCLERNMAVYDFLEERKIPQAYLMSGGYGEENWIIHHQFIRQVLL